VQCQFGANLSQRLYAELEENPKAVSERSGHSTIVLTLDTYSHVLPTMQQQATARLEKMPYIKGGKKRPA
jgi:integrase